MDNMDLNEKKMDSDKKQSEYQLGRYCYCQRILREDDDMDPDKGWACHSCHEVIHESVNFWCRYGRRCIYRKLSNSAFTVCFNCFNRSNGNQSMPLDDSNDNFIYRKLTETFNITKNQLTFSMEQQSRNEDIREVLRRTVSSQFPDIDSETIMNAMDKNEISWNMMRRESEENVVEKLQSIGGLNRNQCLELYRVIKGSDPKVMEVEMRESLYNVYSKFYKKFIMRLNPEDVESEENLNGIKTKFNAMYRDILESLQINLDEHQLGLQKDLFFGDSIDTKTKNSNLSVFDEIKIKWNALELGIKESEFECDCVDVKQCRPLKRIEFIMDLFERHFLKQVVDGKGVGKMSVDVLYMDIMTECLSDYNGVALIDDLDHIRGHKEDIRCVIGTYCDRINADDGSGKCIGEMMRNCRANGWTQNEDDIKSDEMGIEFNHFVNRLGFRERNLLETSTKIHSFICHQVHEEDGDEKNDDYQEEVDGVQLKQKSKAQRLRERTEVLSSKFVNEVESGEKTEELEEKRMEDLTETLRSNGLSDDHCARLTKELQSQCYDSETIIDDLVDEENDPFNLYHHSNLFPLFQSNLFLAKTTKKHFGANRNDDDKLPPFAFGKNRLFHWKEFKDRPGFVAVPKYGSIKEECLQNEIHPMTLKQFTSMLYAAFTLRQSRKGREMKAKDKGGNNEYYEIPAHCSLSVAHIFSLLMYCNDTELQYKYKKYGCRESDFHQSLEDLKESNAEIAWWYKLLVEVVYLFGERVHAKQVLYTGLNVKLYFETFAPVFNAPFSTTVSADVANRFCGADGVILKLVPAAGSWDMYFNVEWLSDFAHEKERLFVFCTNMMIMDIQYFHDQRMQRNSQYLKCFALFSAMFSGHFISPILRDRNKKRGNNAGILLLDLIRVYKANNGIKGVGNVLDICIPLYIQQLFYRLLDNFKADKGMKFVIESECSLLSDSLRKELVEFSPQNAASGRSNGVCLSPMMLSLCESKQLVVMEEYIWVIHDETFDKLQSAKSETIVVSETYYFRLKEQGRTSFVFKMFSKAGGSTSAAVGIEIKETPFPIDSRWSVIIDEVGYNRNDIRYFGKGNGAYQGKFAFKDALFDTVSMLTVKVALHFSPSN